jgi:hypothetical protein
MRGDRAVSEPTWPPTDDDLEQALIDLGQHVVYPPLAPIDATVRERLRAEPAGPAAWPLQTDVRGLWRRLLLALLALAVLAGGALAVSPGVRTAVASWFGLQGAVFLYRPTPPPRSPAPLGAPLGLGQRLILPALGAPDEVYLEALPHGTQVGLVYRPRPGLPAVAGTRVGLLLTEARGSFGQNPAYFKGLEPGTQVEVTQVNATPAYWLTGKPHLFWYTDATGAVITERVRLAGNTLLWAHGGLIFHLESALPREAALRIAASLR